MTWMKTIFALITGIGILFVSSVSYNHAKKQIHEDEVDLLLFYGSFDEDRNGILSIDEIVNFFEWTQHEIEYEAHDSFQSPIQTLKSRRGDCLDISLLTAHLFYVYFRTNACIGDIAVGNQGQRANHACCLMPVSEDTKKHINERLGYQVDYFNDPSGKFTYLIVDCLCCERFSELNTLDYCLVNIKYLHQYYLCDISTILVDH
jgi:hypothetical protein